ncbi:MAG: ATP-binding protein [Coriobacteriia bacterium]|nr:ATP-binding protein [Coriobacteriia bacterium]
MQTLALFSRRKNEHEQKHDYREIYGQNLAKRALLICAVGRHNALCIGSAGSGKSMLIERFVGILPALTEEQSIETAFIHSIKGLEVDEILQGIPPLRAPHHAIGKAGLIGGGIPVAPGEISLAHNGVLFMDEFPEFSSAVLQNLRQPMERGFIRFNRSHKSYEFNARFILLAAANPCPCGNLFEKDTPCTCKESAITRYQSKMAGPLLDRFDLTIEVKRPDSQKILYEKSPLSTREMKVQVLKAHDFRQDRKKQLDISEKLSERDRVLKACRLSKRNLALVEKLSSYHKLSARSIIRVLKVSRSIADFELSQEVLEEHLLEAVAYKVGF